MYGMTEHAATGDQGSASFEHFQHLPSPCQAVLAGGRGTGDHPCPCREGSEVQVQEGR